jgi:hypothetical protein
VVERGAIVLESIGGVRAMFDAGAVLCFASHALAALHNPGSERTVVVAISRRQLRLANR